MKYLNMKDEQPDKYPLDINMHSPSFIAICSDGYAHECWWGFPHKGSMAYSDNHPPKIERIDSNGFRSESDIEYWIPNPTINN